MDTIHRFVFEHRRLLAAAFTALAVLTALSVLREKPDGSPVLVARRDLPSGHVVTAADLRTTLLSSASRPAHSLRRAAAIGRRVAGPMRRGEPFTDYRVLEAGTLAGYDKGSVMTVVRVDQADGLSGVHVGDRVNVVAVDPDGETAAQIVARDVEVVTVPPASEGSDEATLGLVTSEKIALALASAAITSRFSVIIAS